MGKTPRRRNRRDEEFPGGRGVACALAAPAVAVETSNFNLARTGTWSPYARVSPQAPSAVSRVRGLVAGYLGMPAITLHGLRHTHASQLIDAGVDFVTISRRLGQAKP